MNINIPKEELRIFTLNQLQDAMVYVPNYNDRYLNHLENLATDPKPSQVKQSAINSLVRLTNDIEYNRMVKDLILAKRDIPSIFGEF